MEIIFRNLQVLRVLFSRLVILVVSKGRLFDVVDIIMLKEPESAVVICVFSVFGKMSELNKDADFKVSADYLIMKRS